MKQLFISLMFLGLCFYGKSQKQSKLDFNNSMYNPLPIVYANGDTVEIKSNNIKYIKVDGKLFEIKRSVELKEVIEIGYRLKDWLIQDTLVPNRITSTPYIKGW